MVEMEAEKYIVPILIGGALIALVFLLPKITPPVGKTVEIKGVIIE
jgi:hypothetical protein